MFRLCCFLVLLNHTAAFSIMSGETFAVAVFWGRLHRFQNIFFLILRCGSPPPPLLSRGEHYRTFVLPPFVRRVAIQADCAVFRFFSLQFIVVVRCCSGELLRFFTLVLFVCSPKSIRLCHRLYLFLFFFSSFFRSSFPPSSFDW